MRNPRVLGWTTFVCIIAVLCVHAVQAKVNVGDKPDINWVSIDNKPITSAGLKGRLVVIEFWATWCPSCVKEVPRLKTLKEQYKAQEIQFVGISWDRDVAKLEKFTKENNVDWPQVWEQQAEKGDISKAFKNGGFPWIYILSPDGEVLWQGYPKNMEEPLAEAVKKYPLTKKTSTQGPASDAPAKSE